MSTPPWRSTLRPYFSRIATGSVPPATSIGNMQLIPPARNWSRIGMMFPSQSVQTTSTPCLQEQVGDALVARDDPLVEHLRADDRAVLEADVLPAGAEIGLHVLERAFEHRAAAGADRLDDLLEQRRVVVGEHADVLEAGPVARPADQAADADAQRVIARAESPSRAPSQSAGNRSGVAGSSRALKSFQSSRLFSPYSMKCGIVLMSFFDSFLTARSSSRQMMYSSVSSIVSRSKPGQRPLVLTPDRASPRSRNRRTPAPRS